MEPNKPMEVPEENETYTPTQILILKIMRLGAWTAVFSAMLVAMHS